MKTPAGADRDRAAGATYLETATQRSAQGLYARAGYRPHGDPIQFPSGLETYPLWRAARPGVTTI